MSALDLTWYTLKKAWYDNEDSRGDSELHISESANEEARNRREGKDLENFHAESDTGFNPDDDDDYHTFREDGDPHDDDVDNDFSSGENQSGKTSEYHRGWIAGVRHQASLQTPEGRHPKAHRTITGKHTQQRGVMPDA